MPWEAISDDLKAAPVCEGCANVQVPEENIGGDPRAGLTTDRGGGALKGVAAPIAKESTLPNNFVLVNKTWVQRLFGLVCGWPPSSRGRGTSNFFSDSTDFRLPRDTSSSMAWNCLRWSPI